MERSANPLHSTVLGHARHSQACLPDPRTPFVLHFAIIILAQYYYPIGKRNYKKKYASYRMIALYGCISGTTVGRRLEKFQRLPNTPSFQIIFASRRFCGFKINVRIVACILRPGWKDDVECSGIKEGV